MVEKFKNMGNADRLIRFFFGSSLLFVIAYHPGLIGNQSLLIVVGIFALMNVISSVLAICPAYVLAGFSTDRGGNVLANLSTDLVSPMLETEDERKSFTQLKRKLLVSVALPMLGLLLLFTTILLEISNSAARKANELHLSTALTLATSLITAEFSIGKQLEFRNNEAFRKAMRQITTLVVIDNDGNQIPSTFHSGDYDTVMAAAIGQGLQEAEVEYRGIPKNANGGKSMSTDRVQENRNSSIPETLGGDFRMGGQHYSYCIQKIEGTENWITVISEKTGNAELFATILDPKFLITGLIVLWMGIWSSVYIVRKFLQKTAESAAQLEHRNSHDRLTGLPNRSALERILNARMESAKDSSEGIALMMIDVIGFRDINDTMGYELGDQLLIEIAEGFESIDQPDIQLISMGGDVFGVICPSTHDRTSACGFANRIHDSLEEHCVLNKVPISLHGRIGMSFFPTDSTEAPELMRLADIALAQAKNGRLSTCHYQHEKDAHSIRKLSLLARLRTAIDNSELSLVYQPKVNIQDNSLVGVEALIRWTDREYGSVSPYEFVHWAEKSGLINRLTRWVLQTANLQSGEWRMRGLHIPIAVNLSPMNLHDPKLPMLINQLVTKGHLGNGLLELELTENAVMEDPVKAQETMMALHRMGVCFAIDDFGTGLSSFTYLRKFPVSHLKIDRTFVMDPDNCDRDEVLLKSMIDLGHSLQCGVTAEGVEDELTLEKLRTASCDFVQGYHVCKPMPADDLARWIRIGDWEPQQRAA